MRARLLASPFLWWPVTLAALGGLLALAYLVHREVIKTHSKEAAGESVQAPRRAANQVVKLGTRLAESHGIKAEPAEPFQWQERVLVYGRIVNNPRATVEIRAPFAGTLRALPGGDGPGLGQWLDAGQTIGLLDIRVGPQERLDFQMKLTEALLKQRGAEDVLKIQQERVDRFEAAPKSVSRGELDASLVQLAEARTQLAQARAAVHQWQEILAALEQQGDQKNPLLSQPLCVPAAGEVSDLLARPGMVLEAGSVVARVVDFNRVLVRLDLPGQRFPNGPPQAVEVFVPAPPPVALAGASNRQETEAPARTVSAKLLGAAGQVDATSQLAGYLYEVHPTAPSERNQAGTSSPRGPLVNGNLWRPGLFVKTWLQAPVGKPRPAVSIPATALLYHQGRALVYVPIGPGKYERREVRLLGREGDRWILAAGVDAGESVVSHNAQVLLSEEFRSEADSD